MWDGSPSSLWSSIMEHRETEMQPWKQTNCKRRCWGDVRRFLSLIWRNFALRCRRRVIGSMLFGYIPYCTHMVMPVVNSNCALFLQVRYRMDGNVAKTICHVDEKAKDIEHAKKVSQQISKVRSCYGRRGYKIECVSFPPGLRGDNCTGRILLTSPTGIAGLWVLMPTRVREAAHMTGVSVGAMVACTPRALQFSSRPLLHRMQSQCHQSFLFIF